MMILVLLLGSAAAISGHDQGKGGLFELLLKMWTATVVRIAMMELAQGLQ